MEDYFARQELVLKRETGDKIKSTRILVIGAGSGGNEVLKNLALMGFGYFTIIDFDTIEKSNLSRTTLFFKNDIGKSKSQTAAKSLRKITLHDNPEITGIDAKIQDIGKQVFLEHDIVICCVDTMDARAYINDWCVLLNKPFFEMGFDRFTIQISFFPNESTQDSCLRELIGYSDFSGTRQSCSKLKIKDNELEHIPTIQVAAAFAGVFVATEVILYLQNESKLKNSLLQYAAKHHNVLVINIPQKPDCPMHENVKIEIHKSSLTSEKTYKDVLTELREEHKRDFYIKWGDEYIYSMNCEECGKSLLIRKFKSNVFDNERWCKSCIDLNAYKEVPVQAKWKKTSELNLFNPNHVFFLNLSMSDFGVQNKDIILAHDINSNKNKILVLLNI